MGVTLQGQGTRDDKSDLGKCQVGKPCQSAADRCGHGCKTLAILGESGA
jgi:hypothetical protein